MLTFLLLPKVTLPLALTEIIPEESITCASPPPVLAASTNSSTLLTT
jgi:hypothetical protein